MGALMGLARCSWGSRDAYGTCSFSSRVAALLWRVSTASLSWSACQASAVQVRALRGVQSEEVRREKIGSGAEDNA